MPVLSRYGVSWTSLVGDQEVDCGRRGDAGHADQDYVLLI